MSTVMVIGYNSLFMVLELLKQLIVIKEYNSSKAIGEYGLVYLSNTRHHYRFLQVEIKEKLRKYC